MNETSQLNMRTLAALDLNLIKVLHVMAIERHVTRAAKVLGMSQPALSHALRRLRDAFDDQLFVKTSAGMVPTPRAEALAPAISAALTAIAGTLTGPTVFLPAAIRRTFAVRTTDLVEALLVPPLLSSFAATAPQVNLLVRAASPELPRSELESGACDLAIAGYFGDLPDGFFQQQLFQDAFVCAVRIDHPRLGKKRRLTLDDYCGADHILIAPGGELHGQVDEALRRKRKKRRVIAGLSNFLVSGWVTADVDCIVTAPERLLRRLATHLPLKILPPPLTLPPINVVQVWHARHHEDAEHRWLREQVRGALARVRD